MVARYLDRQARHVVFAVVGAAGTDRAQCSDGLTRALLFLLLHGIHDNSSLGINEYCFAVLFLGRVQVGFVEKPGPS